MNTVGRQNDLHGSTDSECGLSAMTIRSGLNNLIADSHMVFSFFAEKRAA